MSGLLQLPVGSVFASDFRIIRPLSEGGMGAVYVVEQLSTGKERALKIMQPALVTQPKLRERFTQEARVASRIDSEHVVEVVAAGVDATTGTPWLAMELLRGETLADRVMREGPLPPALVIELFAQLCHAIGAAHVAGIVHRDLKPENVFLAVSRRAGSGSPFVVKVLDFGIAKIVAEAQTRHTAAIGTPLWMAPEQTEASAMISASADVWALGLIAFYLLTGRFYWRAAAVEGPSAMALMREVCFEPIVPASTRAAELGGTPPPAGFDEWFARCVVRDVGTRLADANVAGASLANAIGNARPVVMKTEPAPQVPNFARTEPMPAAPPLSSTTGPSALAADDAPPTAPRTPLIAALASAAVLLVGGGVYFATRSDEPPPASTVTVPVPAEPPPTAPPPAPSAKSTAPFEQPSQPEKDADVAPTPVDPPKPVVVAPAPKPTVTAAPAPPGGCASYSGDYSAAMRAKEYDCVRSILMPRLNAGSISSTEARYLKAACSALGDAACEKRAAMAI